MKMRLLIPVRSLHGHLREVLQDRIVGRLGYLV
jgi:hypothetical protein